MNLKWQKRWLSDPRGGESSALECPDCHALVYPDEWPGSEFNASQKHAEWHLRLQKLFGVTS